MSSNSSSSSEESSWDPSDVESALIRPSGSPDIRHGLYFENIEEFWEKHSPKIIKPKTEPKIIDAIKEISQNINKTENQQILQKDFPNNSDQLSPIIQRNRLQRPTYNPNISDSPLKGKEITPHIQEKEPSDDTYVGIPSDDEMSLSENSNDEKGQKTKKDDFYTPDIPSDSIGEEPSDDSDERIVIKTSSAKLILPPVAHLPTENQQKPHSKRGRPPKINKEATTKGQEDKNQSQTQESPVHKKRGRKSKKELAEIERKKALENQESENKADPETKKKEEKPTKKLKPASSQPAQSQKLSTSDRKKKTSTSSSQIIAKPRTKDETKKKVKKYNFDNYLDDDNNEPVIIFPEQTPSLEEDAPIALRRSQRIRVKPLKHWAGEHIQYAVGDDNLRSFSGIVRQKVENIKAEAKKEKEGLDADGTNPKKSPGRKKQTPQSKYELTSVPFHQQEIIVEPDGDYAFPVQKYPRHVVHLDGIGRLYLSRHTYNLEDFADFVIPAGQTATITSKCSTRLRLLIIDYY